MRSEFLSPVGTREHVVPYLWGHIVMMIAIGIVLFATMPFSVPTLLAASVVGGYLGGKLIEDLLDAGFDLFQAIF